MDVASGPRYGSRTWIQYPAGSWASRGKLTSTSRTFSGWIWRQRLSQPRRSPQKLYKVCNSHQLTQMRTAAAMLVIVLSGGARPWAAPISL
jgi:hypothetical protein